MPQEWIPYGANFMLQVPQKSAASELQKSPAKEPCQVQKSPVKTPKERCCLPKSPVIWRKALRKGPAKRGLLTTSG
jgi:hypothetical protein